MPEPTVQRHVFRPVYIYSHPGGERQTPCNDCGAPADAPQHYRAPVELDDDGRKWLDELRTVETALAAADAAIMAPLRERHAAAVRNLQSRLNDAEAATVGGVPVLTWAWSKAAAGFDLARFRADHPDLAARYAKDKQPARPFKPVTA